ncbi:MAG: tetratricopeptide repeat protein [Burkholderiales bacterium]
MSSTGQSTLSLRGAQETLGLSRTVLSGLISAGFVTPSRGARNEHRFTFQDLALLRTAYALQKSNIAPRKILASLAKLKASLPTEIPLTGLRITAVGADVAVRDGQGKLESTASGQYLMDFELAGSGAKVSFLDRSPPVVSGPDAATYFRQGEKLEARDGDAALAAYHKAIELDPSFADAYLNLGAMLCEAKRCEAAVSLYDSAIVACPTSALIRFNRAVALEDLGRLEEAVASYELSLKLDPSLADAHFNIARLKERLGDSQSALRHFNAYRKLQR